MRCSNAPGYDYGSTSGGLARTASPPSPRPSSPHLLKTQAMLPDPRQGEHHPYDPGDYVLPANYYGLLNLHQRAVDAIIEWIRGQLSTMSPARLAQAAFALHALEELPWAPQGQGYIEIATTAPNGRTLKLTADKLQAEVGYSHRGPYGPDSELVILLSTSACPSGFSCGHKEETLTWHGENDYETGLDLWIAEVQGEECSFTVEMDCDLHDVRAVPRNWQSLWLDRDELPDEDA